MTKYELTIVCNMQNHNARIFATTLKHHYHCHIIDLNDHKDEFDHVSMYSVHRIVDCSESKLYVFIQDPEYWFTNDENLPLLYVHYDYIPTVRYPSVVLGFNHTGDNGTTHGLQTYSVFGDYEWKSIDCFINPFAFQINPSKDTLLIDIPDTVPFRIYKEQLERSQFLVTKGNQFRKRVLEALYCRTTPIVIYTSPNVKDIYEKYGLSPYCYFIDHGLEYFRTGERIGAYNRVKAEDGHWFVLTNFTLENQLSKIKKIIEEYL